MSYSPQQIDDMSWFQFFSAVEGWFRANTSSEGLSDKEKDELWEWMDTQPPVPLSRRLH